MSHQLRTTFLVIVAVVLLTGCSWSQVFRISLTVVDKTDSKPITGAQAEVDTSYSSDERKNDPVPPGTGHQTDVAGSLDFDVSISGYTPTSSGGERWYLKVRKEGYEPVVIDIKPKPAPERNKDGPIPLNVKVEMQP